MNMGEYSYRGDNASYAVLPAISATAGLLVRSVMEGIVSLTIITNIHI